MITLKLKRDIVDIQYEQLIQSYQDQYAICVRVIYNLLYDQDELKSCYEYLKQDSICIQKLDQLNHIELMNSWFKQCAIKEAYQLIKSDPSRKVIFGGRQLFKKISQHKISKEDFLKERHNYPLYSIGNSKPIHGNRFFEIAEDLEHIIFKPNRKLSIKIPIHIQNYKAILSKLYERQVLKDMPITYKIDNNYIYISYDECKLKTYKHNFIKNRILALDLNPNYIGLTITDWKDENDFNLVYSCVYSMKDLNDEDYKLKHKKHRVNGKKVKGYASTSPERQHITNLRHHNVIEIIKNIVNKAIHYKCEIIAIEDLTIESCDKCRGTRFNKLCNNQWCRTLIVQQLEKRCGLHHIKLLKSLACYSSFIGNLLYRNLHLPDMCLSSIEIGRRAFEFNRQYITKEKEKEKNVVFPGRIAYQLVLTITKEVFGQERCEEDWINLYKFFKKSKLMYRLPLDKETFPNLESTKLLSEKSKVKLISNFSNKLTK